MNPAGTMPAEKRPLWPRQGQKGDLVFITRPALLGAAAAASGRGRALFGGAARRAREAAVLAGATAIARSRGRRLGNGAARTIGAARCPRHTTINCWRRAVNGPDAAGQRQKSHGCETDKILAKHGILQRKNPVRNCVNGARPWGRAVCQGAHLTGRRQRFAVSTSFREKRGQVPLCEAPFGPSRRRYLTPFFPNAVNTTRCNGGGEWQEKGQPLQIERLAGRPADLGRR